MMKRKSSQSVWNDVLGQLDLDGDGIVDYHEFMTAAVNYEKVLT